MIGYDENILQEPYSFWHCWQRQIHFPAFKWSMYGLKTITSKVEEPSIVGWTSKFVAALFSSKKEESNSLTMLSLNLSSK